MNKQGLLVEPKFTNANFYLQSGEMTNITNNIKAMADKINCSTDGKTLRKIICWIHSNTVRLNSPNDKRKFKRTADEILLSKERTGCCDTATLFTAIARAKGIPTMEIITFSKTWGKNVDIGMEKGTEGHFYAAAYVKDINNKEGWVLINPDKYVTDEYAVKISYLNINDRNITDNFYSFAYVKDFRDVEVDGLKINSISNMGKIQKIAYMLCDRRDLHSKEEYER